jgi:hypothetical protein
MSPKMLKVATTLTGGLWACAAAAARPAMIPAAAPRQALVLIDISPKAVATVALWML